MGAELDELHTFTADSRTYCCLKLNHFRLTMGRTCSFYVVMVERQKLNHFGHHPRTLTTPVTHPDLGILAWTSTVSKQRLNIILYTADRTVLYYDVSSWCREHSTTFGSGNFRGSVRHLQESPLRWDRQFTSRGANSSLQTLHSFLILPSRHSFDITTKTLF